MLCLNMWTTTSVAILLVTFTSFCDGGKSLGPSGINCYTCSSTNGSQRACEDPIDTSIVPYTEKCTVPKKGHTGLFPAHFCIKIVGRNSDTSESLVVRACAMKTMDSQCGEFQYQNVDMVGCVLTCDYNGCNHGWSLRTNVARVSVFSALFYFGSVCLISLYSSINWL